MGLAPLLPGRPSGRGGLQVALPGQGRALREGEPSFLGELQSEPAELNVGEGQWGAAAPVGLCRCSRAHSLRKCLREGKGRAGLAQALHPQQGEQVQ